MKSILALFASVRLALGLPSQDQQIDVVAAVLWAEARSEGATGIDAVAEVIRNRTFHPKDFAASAYGVVTQARQFTCLNHIGAPELIARAKGSAGIDKTMWHYSRLIAEELVDGRFDSTATGDALFFTSWETFTITSPRWKAWETVRYVTTIGRHNFYR